MPEDALSNATLRIVTAILGEAEFMVSGDKDLVDDEKLKTEMLKRGVKVI